MTSLVVTTGTKMAAAGFPGLEVCGEAIVALIDDDIGTMGVVIMARRDTSTTEFDSDDIDRARSLADQLAASLRRSMLHRQMQFEARHDALHRPPEPHDPSTSPCSDERRSRSTISIASS